MTGWLISIPHIPLHLLWGVSQYQNLFSFPLTRYRVLGSLDYIDIERLSLTTLLTYYPIFTGLDSVQMQETSDNLTWSWQSLYSSIIQFTLTKMISLVGNGTNSSGKSKNTQFWELSGNDSKCFNIEIWLRRSTMLLLPSCINGSTDSSSIRFK